MEVGVLLEPVGRRQMRAHARGVDIGDRGNGETGQQAVGLDGDLVDSRLRTVDAVQFQGGMDEIFEGIHGFDLMTSGSG